MPGKTSKFLIGLFVMGGIIIGAGVIVWIGASKYFQKGATYVTFFDESVQGLQLDSSVKYRGVDVGRVERIRVAPDYKLVEVVMKVELEGDLQQNTVAQLKTAGITGIVFIELDRTKPEDPDYSPQIDFAAEYPIIPSRPSELRQLLSGVDEVLNNIKEIDFKGLSDQFKLVGKAAENLLAGKKMNSIMTNLESTSASMERAVARIDSLVAEGRIEEVLTEARDSLMEAKNLIAGVRKEVESLKLADTAEKTNQLVEGIDRRSRAISTDLRATTENLQQSSETLQNLLDRLNTTPSDLIFSTPPATRRQ
ncbi:MAG: MCE family protein [Deltaproteobacteria bacterium]|nr:MCE family protein [Deltaproteobacteria bacterium]